MTRADFEREVAEATGESRATIRKRGFSLMIVPDRRPLTVDWDAVQQAEPRLYRPRSRPKNLPAAA